MHYFFLGFEKFPNGLASAGSQLYKMKSLKIYS